MSEIGYDDIQEAWERETQNESLQDLEDLRLNGMVAYVSEVRLSLAAAADTFQADLLNQEGQNLEFMLRDLLMLRRDKILRDILELRKPQGIMTLPEEELYNRLMRGIKGHLEFVRDSLTGIDVTISKRGKASESDLPDDTDEIEYITVRFLKPTDIPAEGLDGRTYGPYDQEDIARMPSSTALIWINQRIAARVMTEEFTSSDEDED